MTLDARGKGPAEIVTEILSDKPAARPIRLSQARNGQKQKLRTANEKGGPLGSAV